jgi:hypothetical protein
MLHILSRRAVASDYSDDKRNLEAADLLDRLAGTVGDVPFDLLNAYVELFEDAPDAEVNQEMLHRLLAAFSAWSGSPHPFDLRRDVALLTGLKRGVEPVLLLVELGA